MLRLLISKITFNLSFIEYDRMVNGIHNNKKKKTINPLKMVENMKVMSPNDI